jgi:DNA-directed RNA polymerase specialized sigma subunit
MKHYNRANYSRYKKDLDSSISRIEGKFWDEYTKDELIIKFMPYAEEIARSFSTAEKVSGIINLEDLIQEANASLVYAINRLDFEVMNMDDDIEKQIKGFISKRIRGGVRRAIDAYRGDIRIPEYKLTEIRKDNGKDHLLVEMFFNSIFLSIDEKIDKSDDATFEVEDKHEDYNIVLLNKYILSLMKKHLTDKEYNVLRLSYGLDCDKIPAKKIAEILEIKGTADFVRVSQIKRDAIDKLINNVDPEDVLDFIN